MELSLIPTALAIWRMETPSYPYLENKSIELPVGFAMSLAMNKNAMDYYSSLSFDNQMKIVSYIQDNNTGFEVKNRINNAISNLENGNIHFIGH